MGYDSSIPGCNATWKAGRASETCYTADGPMGPIPNISTKFFFLQCPFTFLNSDPACFP